MDNSYKTELSGSSASTTLRFEIPSAVGSAVAAGKAAIGATFGMRGMECWVQFLEPSLFHETFTLEDAETRLIVAKSRKKHDSSPSSTEISPESSSSPEAKGKMKTRLTTVTSTYDAEKARRDREEIRMTVSEAVEIVASRNLNRHRTNGVLNEYAHDSLVRQDFNRSSIHDFVARATYVASNIGEDKAVSRIATNTFLKVNGVTTLEGWWSEATPLMRGTLLTSAKKCDLTKVNVHALRRLGCPFGQADLMAQDSE